MATLLEGWVLKQSRFVGEWRPRWLVLVDGDDGATLSTHKEPTALERPTETLPLARVTKAARISAPQPLEDGTHKVFELHAAGRIFYFACAGGIEASMEADRWVAEIGARTNGRRVASRRSLLAAQRSNDDLLGLHNKPRGSAHADAAQRWRMQAL
eukprot:7376311-Prymnesium_polylepis.1